jgi:hypothetical protein
MSMLREDWEDMFLTENEDGTVTTDGFPDVIGISLRVLADAKPEMLWVDAGPDPETPDDPRFWIHIRLANGRAIYQVMGTNPARNILVCERISGGLNV